MDGPQHDDTVREERTEGVFRVALRGELVREPRVCLDNHHARILPCQDDRGVCQVATFAEIIEAASVLGSSGPADAAPSGRTATARGAQSAGKQRVAVVGLVRMVCHPEGRIPKNRCE
jgi:hypothetical protein